MKSTSKIITALSYMILLLPLLIFLSCKKEEKKELLVGKISHQNFENSLDVGGVVESVRSTVVSCPRGSRAKITYLMEDGTKVKEGDVVCILENEDMQKEYDGIQIELEMTRANRNRTEADLNMQYALLDAQVKSNAAQTSITNLDSLQLKYLSPVKRRIKELELQKAAIQKAKLERKLKALDFINKTQVKNLDMQIQSLEFRVQGVKDQLDQMSLKSPQSGMAFRGRFFFTNNKWMEGDQVFGGMPIINIPDYSEMKVIIQASEATYKQINVNDSVEYTFDAMPGNKARGIILKKAPVGQPVKENSKVKMFEIEASITKADKLPEPGLTAHCKVVMLRVKDAIVLPQISIFDENASKFVYVRQQDKFEKRQVTIGATSLKKAVITAGLTGYEHISLSKPSPTKVSKTTLLPKKKKQKKIQKKSNR